MSSAGAGAATRAIGGTSEDDTSAANHTCGSIGEVGAVLTGPCGNDVHTHEVEVFCGHGADAADLVQQSWLGECAAHVEALDAIANREQRACSSGIASARSAASARTHLCGRLTMCVRPNPFCWSVPFST